MRARAGRRGALRLVRGRGRRAPTWSTAVGADSYAERLAGEARAFRHPRSPLERALEPAAARARRRDGAARARCSATRCGSRTRRPAMRSPTAVAAVVTLVPEGLVLLDEPDLRGRRAAHGPARRARAAAERDRVARLGRRGLPRQDRHADRGRPASARAVPADGVDDAASSQSRSARYAASAPSRNATLDGDRGGASRRRAEPPSAEVPFSSRRRWSALRLGGERARARRAGALPARRRSRATPPRRPRPGGASSPSPRHRAPLARPARRRRRRAGSSRSASSSSASGCGPRRARRSRSSSTQGVELKVLSGDAPETVAAIAARRRHPVAGRPLDGARAAGRPERCARRARGAGGRPDLARGQAARRRGAARATAATWRWSATASTTCRR